MLFRSRGERCASVGEAVAGLGRIRVRAGGARGRWWPLCFAVAAVRPPPASWRDTGDGRLKAYVPLESACVRDNERERESVEEEQLERQARCTRVGRCR